MSSSRAVTRPLKFDIERRRVFLDSVAEQGIVKVACVAADISQEMIRICQRDDPDFREQLEAAKAEFLRRLRTEAYRRAVEGWVERETTDPQGNTTTVTKYSDQLLLALLKRHDPEMRERLDVDARTEHSGTVETRHTLDIEATVRSLDRSGRDALRVLLDQLPAEAGRAEEIPVEVLDS